MAEGKPNKPKITPGYRVGKLTVEEETPQRRCGYTVWRCRCDCGGRNSSGYPVSAKGNNKRLRLHN